ncbi:hypothetical protein RIF29_12957 [Crotalaria pallida]|uniref:KIB1-4 beta-propeller domain-containing protein n=1 Tax=Crotalaria pallida TaxID=3830 RepID=A0AAN9INW5_CROPI
MLSLRAFFHLSNHKTHLLNLPEPSNRIRYCGSSHGWVVILDETPEIRLLNLITRTTLRLPQLDTFPNVVSFSYSNIGREYLVTSPHGGVHALNLSQMCNSFVRKVVLSSSPSLQSSFNDFAAFAIVGQGQHSLAFCKKGHDSWDFILSDELYCWEDVVYHNGLFYVVTNEGTIAVCDIYGYAPPQVTIIQTAPIEFSGDIYYVVFLVKDMLLVARFLEQVFDDDDVAGGVYNLVYRTVGFEAFKMNWGEMKWEKIETLGDHVLFVGGNSSLSLVASDFDGCCLKDCIYFTDDYSDSNYDDACGKHDVGVFSLWDKSIELLPCYPRNSHSRLGWPLPIWVSPNPC